MNSGHETKSDDGGERPSVTVITHSPSPYQVELFDEVERLEHLRLEIVYLYAQDAQRFWKSPEPRHEHVLLNDASVDDAQVLERTDKADLVVINYYKHPFARAVMQRRAASGAAMGFWGERPQASALSALNRLLRRLRLRSLLHSNAPVWGIGRMAVEAYQREFGSGRNYINLPYFSDLGRFSAVPEKTDDGTCVFLYSGSLSPRKGVDVLATSFARLASDFPQARLRIMGSGESESSMLSLLQSCMDRVEYIGFRDWKDLPAEYARADFLCVPSRHDGWGMVVPEGLAAGLPVISTHQTGSAVEFIRPDQNGWLIPGDDEEALYRALKEAVILSTSQRSSMSLLARESMAGHSLRHGAERFVEAANAALHDWQKPSTSSASAAGSR